ncbi:MAG: hypothetical protein NDJ89_15530 [Oligoflexia bacterium]|nr:hypothetical protein [Oligoflexia bacterium]
MIPNLRLRVGLSDSFDLGIEYEFFSLGLIAKYAISHDPEGFSYAMLGGAGTSPSDDSSAGSYVYLGAIASGRFGAFEPFVLTRFNHVWQNGRTFDFGPLGGVTLPAGSFSYFNFALGSSVWPVNWFGLAFALNALSSGASTDASPFYPTGSLLFRF